VDRGVAKFTITWGASELSPVLKNLGMTDAFVPGRRPTSRHHSDPRGMYLSLGIKSFHRGE